MRGGATTVVPKDYVYTICLFRNVTQQPYDELSWNAVEKSTHLRDQPGTDHDGIESSGKAAPSAKKRKTKGRKGRRARDDVNESLLGEPTLLGQFVGWSLASAPYEVLPPDQAQALSGGVVPATERVMVYMGGPQCGEIQRVSMVSLQCGVETGVVAAEEDGLCQYKFAVQTPLVCSHAEADAAREILAQLRRA